MLSLVSVVNISTRRVILYAIILALAIIAIAPAARAQPELMIPFIGTDHFYYINPSEFATLFIQETNTTHLATSDTAALAITFRPVREGKSGGYTVAPAIAQTVAESLAFDRAYTFHDAPEGLLV